MAKIPPLRRIVAEDFPDQKSWVGKLLSPLNLFMDTITNALSKGLTFRDNFAGEVVEFETDGTYPVKLPWSRKGRPVGVWVVDARRKSDATLPTAAVYAPWSFSQAGQVNIKTVTGVSPTPSARWVVTVVIIEG